jgi:hypothetical protein
MKKDRTGFMSYTHDPSLRHQMSGPIEPMEYDPAPGTTPLWAILTGLGIAGAILYMILQGEMPV